MSGVITLMLLVILSSLAPPPCAGSGLSRHYQKPSQSAAPAGPLIGYIKDEGLVDLCGCGFEHRSSSRAGYTFSSDASGQTAWMNIDGQDVKLKLTHSTGPKKPGRGSRYIDRYKGQGVEVTLVMTVTRLCIPYGPGCETIGYDVIITVTKGDRRQSVKAKGQCGCV